MILCNPKIIMGNLKWYWYVIQMILIWVTVHQSVWPRTRSPTHTWPRPARQWYPTCPRRVSRRSFPQPTTTINGVHTQPRRPQSRSRQSPQQSRDTTNTTTTIICQQPPSPTRPLFIHPSWHTSNSNTTNPNRPTLTRHHHTTTLTNNTHTGTNTHPPPYI